MVQQRVDEKEKEIKIQAVPKITQLDRSIFEPKELDEHTKKFLDRNQLAHQQKVELEQIIENMGKPRPI